MGIPIDNTNPPYCANYAITPHKSKDYNCQFTIKLYNLARMGELPHILVLALIQGVTEFLPISSSAHLILASSVSGVRDQGVAIDLALHGGTLLAVLVYFRRDIVDYCTAPFSRATQCLLIATLPIVIVGGLLFFSTHLDIFRMVYIIAWANLIFALPLWLADHYCPARRDMYALTRKQALLIGVVQIFSLIPGASRTGVVITAGRMFALSREAAARFSILLSIPVIGLLALANLWQLTRAPDSQMLITALIAMAASAGVAFAIIHIFLDLTRRISFLPFVMYRIMLAIAILLWL